MEKRYLSVKELSKYLGIAEQTIYQLTSQNRIPYIKIGRLKFDKAKIDIWMNEHSNELNRKFQKSS